MVGPNGCVHMSQHYQLDKYRVRKLRHGWSPQRLGVCGSPGLDVKTRLVRYAGMRWKCSRERIGFWADPPEVCGAANGSA